MKVSRLEQITDGHKQEVEQFAVDVLTGFSSAPKRLATKYFYDDTGSELFRAITQHEDYYLTRTEYDILDANSKRLPGLLDEGEIDIIELGAGNGHKSQLVIDGFLEAGVRVNFYPIDISEKAMDMLGETIREKPNLSVQGLIGFDLKKDITELITAYSDSSNHTRDFNLNLLARINRELGGNFDLSGFQHYAVYNPVLGAMESYLLALREQRVFIEALQREFSFTAFQPIHLEYSFKFLPADIDYLCLQTGYRFVENLSDPQERFIDSLWQVKKQADLGSA